MSDDSTDSVAFCSSETWQGATPLWHPPLPSRLLRQNVSFFQQVRLVCHKECGSLGIILRHVADKEMEMIEHLTGKGWLVADASSMNLPK